MSMPNIENLVFEGGGTKGSAYAGCISVMDELGLYEKVKRTGGTSAGSITATLLACGAGSAGLTESVYKTDFREFIYDRGGILGDIWRSLFGYGLHTGDKLVSILRDYLFRFSGNADLTFSQLDQKVAEAPDTFKHLSVIASNLNRQQPQVFSAATTPALEIWKAVRASVSIPVLFEPMKINHEYFVDGGLGWVYPIDLYDSRSVNTETGECEVYRNPATLGFYLEDQSLVKTGKRFNPPCINIKSLKQYAESMATFLIQNANADHIHPDDKCRTVFIDDLGVSGTTFDTPKKVIDELVESGRSATQAYFNQLNTSDEKLDSEQATLRAAGKG